MLHVREPVVHPVEIIRLRPTQITVGMREVEEKRKHWRENKDDKKGDFLGRHMIPVIYGPKERYYVIDHHHLARALHEEEVESVLVSVVADFRKLDQDVFWTVLDHHAWVHPYDAKGHRQDFKSIPKSVTGLIDDPFRSLAGALRRMGGFAKETTPFSEFLWADFLRRRLKRARVEAQTDDVLQESLALAKSLDANYLPGWCGPVSN